MPAPEVTALLALLLSLTHSPHTPTPHTATDSGAVAGSSTGPAGPSHTQSTQFSETELEIQYLALSALAQCFPKAQQTALLSGEHGHVSYDVHPCSPQWLYSLCSNCAGTYPFVAQQTALLSGETILLDASVLALGFPFQLRPEQSARPCKLRHCLSLRQGTHQPCRPGFCLQVIMSSTSLRLLPPHYTRGQEQVSVCASRWRLLKICTSVREHVSIAL